MPRTADPEPREPENRPPEERELRDTVRGWLRRGSDRAILPHLGGRDRSMPSAA